MVKVYCIFLVLHKELKSDPTRFIGSVVLPLPCSAAPKSLLKFHTYGGGRERESERDMAVTYSLHTLVEVYTFLSVSIMFKETGIVGSSNQLTCLWVAKTCTGQ